MSDLAIIGSENYGEFYKVRGIHNVGHFNPFKVEQDLCVLAKQLVKDNPEIGVMLLECAVMPQSHVFKSEVVNSATLTPSN